MLCNSEEALKLRDEELRDLGISTTWGGRGGEEGGNGVRKEVWWWGAEGGRALFFYLGGKYTFVNAEKKKEDCFVQDRSWRSSTRSAGSGIISPRFVGTSIPVRTANTVVFTSMVIVVAVVAVVASVVVVIIVTFLFPGVPH